VASFFFRKHPIFSAKETSHIVAEKTTRFATRPPPALLILSPSRRRSRRGHPGLILPKLPGSKDRWHPPPPPFVGDEP
jgi:hypothetical protein